MIKEPIDVDLVTTGREPTPEEFQKISEWIRSQKAKNSKSQSKPEKVESAS